MGPIALVILYEEYKYVCDSGYCQVKNSLQYLLKHILLNHTTKVVLKCLPLKQSKENVVISQFSDRLIEEQIFISRSCNTIPAYKTWKYTL